MRRSQEMRSDPAEVKKLATLYARCACPVVGDVRFTTAGFSAYLATMLQA